MGRKRQWTSSKRKAALVADSKVRIKVEPHDVELPKVVEPLEMESPEVEPLEMESPEVEFPEVESPESESLSKSRKVEESLKAAAVKLDSLKLSSNDMKPVWVRCLSTPGDLAMLAKQEKIKILPQEEASANKRRQRNTLPHTPTAQLLRYLITHVNNVEEAATGESTKKGKPTVKKQQIFKVEYIENMEITKSHKIVFHAKLSGASAYEVSTYPGTALDPKVVNTFMQDYTAQLDEHVLSKGTPWDELLKGKKRQSKVGPFEWLWQCTPSDFVYKCTYKEKKYEQRLKLREIEDDLNKAHKSVIAIVNEVDLELLLIDFKPINVSVASDEIIFPDNSFQIGCECTTGCKAGLAREVCCPTLHGVKHMYDDNELAKYMVNTAIYECNSACPCGMDCPNRVVQKGTVFALKVFRTTDGRGWGVKTMEDVPKGSFVIEYVGEVITDTQAEARGLEYDGDGLTYLFDMDYFETEYKMALSIDATKFGNISRFVNHSCGPNMMVYNVWVECSDPALQRIAFFACRDISADEELTFDYRMSLSESKTDKDESSKKPATPAARNSIPCLCGAVNCRGVLISN